MEIALTPVDCSPCYTSVKKKMEAAYFVIAMSPSADGRKLHPHPDPLSSRGLAFLNSWNL